jgi:hypothetical protein
MRPSFFQPPTMIGCLMRLESLLKEVFLRRDSFFLLGKNRKPFINCVNNNILGVKNRDNDQEDQVWKKVRRLLLLWS